jgi:iron(II)-dependent oxidoreductase
MTIAVAPDRALPQALAERLGEARARTSLLVGPLSDEELHTQHDSLMSPIVWDLGHIAHFEELWLTRNLDGPIEFVEMPGMYNPFEHPRSTRGALPLPGLAECRAIMDEIRGRVLARIASADLDDANPLLRDGYVYRMVLQHEYQHNETILQTLQLKLGAPYAPPARFDLPSAPTAIPPAGMVRFPGGRIEIGTDDRSEAYDNERPHHLVEVRPFFIDVHPVTYGDFLRFMEAGGYTRPEHWSDAGRRWLAESRAQGPKYWFAGDGGWMTRRMDRTGPVDPGHPVCHVCWYEAEAYARFAGKRLPTEIEWEAAASWDPAAGRKRLFPWGEEPASAGLANLDQLGFGTAPVGAYPRNLSPIGC